MAAASTSDDEIQEGTEECSLESMSLVWLDGSTDVKENRNTQQKLRAIINNLKVLQNEKEFQEYMNGLPKIHQIVLVVSSTMGMKVVPSIHNCNDKLDFVASCY